MQLLNKFKELSLSKQLQVLFTVSASALILFLILISYYLIYWLKSQLSDDISALVIDTEEEQLIRLMVLNSRTISNELSYFLSLSIYLSALHKKICEGNFPLSPGEGTFNVTEAQMLDKACFFTRESLTSQGYELVRNESALDSILPLLKSSNLLQIYFGFEVDLIFHSYPAVVMPAQYNPSIREWYYTAKGSSEAGIFTEPYLDASSGVWIISTSSSVYCYDKFVGVAATDITLKSIRSRLNSANLPNGGFFMLVSASGIVVTMPPNWKGETVRLNDTEKTGFSSELWQTTTNKQTPLDYQYKFTDQNSNLQICYRSQIIPSGQTQVTHYLFSCSSKISYSIFSQKPEDVFKKTNSDIFWIILGIAFGVFLLTVGIIFWISRKINAEFNVLVKTVYGICTKSIFPDTLSYFKYSAEEHQKHLFGLGSKGIEKIEKLQCKEKEFFGFTWGVTRPNDKFLYNEWENRKFPRNLKSCVQIKWRELFVEIIKRAFHYGNFE